MCIEVHCFDDRTWRVILFLGKLLFSVMSNDRTSTTCSFELDRISVNLGNSKPEG